MLLTSSAVRTVLSRLARRARSLQGFSTVHAALDDFVAGETLTGDNAYSCEICGRKVPLPGLFALDEDTRRVASNNLPVLK